MTMSRRGFVGAMAGSAGAFALGIGRHSWASGSDKFGPFQMGMQSYTLRAFPIDKVLEAMQTLGMATVEFFDAHYPHNSSDEQIVQMNEKLAGHQLKLLSHGVHTFTKDHEANRRLFEFAKRAGIRNLTADPAEDAFDSLDKLVAEYDVRVAIHNHGPGTRYDKIESVSNAIKGRHPNIGTCPDLGHFIRSGEDPVRAIRLFEGRLFGLHLKDVTAARGDAKNCILGQGVLDLAGTFQALQRVGFPVDACLALEYEENPDDPIADVKQCLAAAEATAKKVFAS